MGSHFNMVFNRRLGLPLVALLALAACDTGIDLGSLGGNVASNRSAQSITAPRPAADSRGVISYPNYQVVVARRGDTIVDLANRIGLDPNELARHNGLPEESNLREGEVLALPRRVASSGPLDIASIAASAIDSAGTSDAPIATAVLPDSPTGLEPIRHRVERGETAYSIARLYNVSVTALSSWNGLGANLAVREGQHLLIPLVQVAADTGSDSSKPGTGSSTPTPPSASKPLPRAVVTAALPPSPDLGQFRSDDSGGRKFLAPVQGKVISPYTGKSGGNEGVDIAATAGTAVKAAEDGEVALISKSVGANTIVLIRHADNIYTVYSNVTDVRLSKGQKIKRGQRLAVVADGSPAYLHFEVRRGTESVDPAPFLN